MVALVFFHFHVLLQAFIFFFASSKLLLYQLWPSIRTNWMVAGEFEVRKKNYIQFHWIVFIEKKSLTRYEFIGSCVVWKWDITKKKLQERNLCTRILFVVYIFLSIKDKIVEIYIDWIIISKQMDWCQLVRCARVVLFCYAIAFILCAFHWT